MKLLFLILTLKIIIFYAAATCPFGAIESLTDKTVCYLFSSAKLAYLNAEEFCVQHGGHLASIHDGFNDAFISGIYYYRNIF